MQVEIILILFVDMEVKRSVAWSLIIEPTLIVKEDSLLGSIPLKFALDTNNRVGIFVLKNLRLQLNRLQNNGKNVKP